MGDSSDKSGRWPESNGPNPIPYKTLTVEKMIETLEMALMPSTKERAKVIMQNMEKESGAWGMLFVIFTDISTTINYDVPFALIERLLGASKTRILF